MVHSRHNSLLSYGSSELSSVLECPAADGCLQSLYCSSCVVVLRSQWESCFGIPMVPASNDNVMEFETPPSGDTYIVQTVGDNGINYCMFGLRVHLTVQPHDCAPSDMAVLCSGHGSCQIQTYNQSSYSCVCEYGYYQRYCSEYDACISTPCKNGGECIDGIAGAEFANFTCDCLDGYTGEKHAPTPH